MTEILQTLSGELWQEAENILSFWETKMTDNENGGFYGRIDGNNVLHPKAEKGAVLNARILWSFSSAYRVMKDKKYLKIAKYAKEYFVKNFIDEELGGVFWTIDYKGNPADTKKQIYAQSFAVYAFAEYYKITKDEAILDKAKELFYLIEKHSFDKKLGGYFEAYSRDWKLLDDLRLSDKDANEAKTMNTHLHVLEAYTNLYRIWKSQELQKALSGLILTFVEKIVNTDKASFNLFFDENWTLKSHETSFGHDIEGSWLLFEAAEVLGDKKILTKVKKTAIEMAQQVYENGLDADGAVFNEGENGKVLDSDKHWWPQNEGVVGFFNAWQLTKDEKFLKASQNVWNFSKKHLLDKENGEWFFRVSKDYRVYTQEDKAGLWKCPYHNSRMCFEIIERIKNIIK